MTGNKPLRTTETFPTPHPFPGPVHSSTLERDERGDYRQLVFAEAFAKFLSLMKFSIPRKCKYLRKKKMIKIYKAFPIEKPSQFININPESLSLGICCIHNVFAIYMC